MSSSAHATAAATPGEVISTWLVFTFVVIASSKLALLAPRLALPLITGYLVAGAIAGPYVLGIVSSADVPRLGYVTQFALAFIAFSAGSELYLPELRQLLRRILAITGGIAVVTFAICTAVIYAVGSTSLVPFMASLEPPCRASVSLIASSIMAARSPASAIAVVKEMRAKGPMVSTLLGVTVAGDVVVLLSFTLATTISESACKGDGFSGAALGIMLATITASILLGWMLGHFLTLLMTVRRLPALRLLILPLGLGVFVTCNWFTEWSHENLPYVLNFEPLLMCITAGFVTTNRSSHRHRFLTVLQQSAPWVFLPFFTLTGASLDLRVLGTALGFAAIVALARAASIFVGSSAGGWLSGQDRSHNLYIWMTLLTQVSAWWLAGNSCHRRRDAAVPHATSHWLRAATS